MAGNDAAQVNGRFDTEAGAGLPLEGIKILDFTHAIFGALAARLLADFGADVVKVENPEGGDFNRARTSGLNPTPGVDSPGFLSLNYNKRSLALDLGSPAGREALDRLPQQADVIMHNFRPQVAEKLGIDARSVMEINPRAVYCGLSGYGSTGPLAHRRGGDPYAQALTGVVPAQGSPGQPPFLGFTTWVDHGGAALAALGVALAIMQRARTGIGQVMETNLVDVSIYCQSSSALAHLLAGGPPTIKGGRGASGAFPWGAYRVADGDVVVFLGGNDQEWPRLCAAIGLPELVDDERFSTDIKRRAHREELYALFDREFLTGTRDEWAARFLKHGLRCDPALTHEEMLGHPQIVHNEIIAPCPTDGGPDSFLTIANPLRMNGQRPAIRVRPPDIGEHSRDILQGWGFTPEDIDRLFAAGVARAREGAAQPAG